MNLSRNILKLTCLPLLLVVLCGCGDDDGKSNGEVKQSKTRPPPQRPIDLRDTAKPHPPPMGAPAESLESYIDQMLNAKSQAGQIAAVEKLISLGSTEAVKALLGFVAGLPDGDFKDGLVKRAAALNNVKCLPAIIEAITSSVDPGAQRIAMEVFGKLADDRSLQQVLDAYDASNDVNLRGRLESAVSSISNQNVVPVLMQILSDPGKSAGDGMVRASSLALRQIGTAPAVDAIIEKINSGTSDEFHALLSAELGRVTNPAAESSLQSAAMGRSKFASTPDARVAAVWALLNFPSAETRDSLQQLKSDPEVQVSFAASEALRAIEARLKQP